MTEGSMRCGRTASAAGPTTESSAHGIEVFLETDSFDTKAQLSQLKGKLPVYMLPHNILVLRRLPLNANGKYDRKALQLILETAFWIRSAAIATPLTRCKPGCNLEINKPKLTLLATLMWGNSA